MSNDDENAVKTVSKCLARMKGCWGPEFEPSVEEIVNYPMISLLRLSQFAFSSELVFRAGGFPYSVEHMAGEGQPAQAARPNSVRAYGACAVCQCVLVRIYGGVFVRDSGRSLKVFHYIPSSNLLFCGYEVIMV